MGLTHTSIGFPSGSAVKNLPAMQETGEMWDQSLGREDSPGGGNGKSLQYSCLGNSILRRASTHTHAHQYYFEAAKSHPTLCDPMDWSLPGSSVPGTP